MDTESQEITSADTADIASAVGEGAAFNASVVTSDGGGENEISELEQALTAARARAETKMGQRKIDAAELAVKTAEAHLAGAHDALAVAKREVAEEAEAAAAAAAAQAEAPAEATDATETEGN